MEIAGALAALSALIAILDQQFPGWQEKLVSGELEHLPPEEWARAMPRSARALEREVDERMGEQQ